MVQTNNFFDNLNFEHKYYFIEKKEYKHWQKLLFMLYKVNMRYMFFPYYNIMKEPETVATAIYNFIKTLILKLWFDLQAFSLNCFFAIVSFGPWQLWCGISRFGPSKDASQKKKKKKILFHIS